MIELALILILWLYLLVLLIVIAAWIPETDRPRPLRSHPGVSILVAARNEQNSIERCLRGLLNLNYPSQCIEILIGDDRSEDGTALIIKKLAEEYPYIKYVYIGNELGKARAKGNVLAQLVRLAESDYIFVTDADIVVSPEWINSLLPHLIGGKVGIVSGSTIVDGESVFDKWQGLDWFFGTACISAFQNLGIYSTAIGNNMAFLKKAYIQTGGFESMKFSVTEDFQLFTAIRKLGYSSVNLSDKASLNVSAPQPNLNGLLHQRKRWLMGAADLPWYWIFVFGIQGAFYPVLFILMAIHLEIALKIWLIKWIIQQLFLLAMHYRLKRKLSWLAFLSFEFYSIFNLMATLVFYAGPGKMDWRGRKYSHNGNSE